MFKEGDTIKLVNPFSGKMERFFICGIAIYMSGNIRDYDIVRRVRNRRNINEFLFSSIKPEAIHSTTRMVLVEKTLNWHY